MIGLKTFKNDFGLFINISSSESIDDFTLIFKKILKNLKVYPLTPIQYGGVEGDAPTLHEKEYRQAV